VTRGFPFQPPEEFFGRRQPYAWSRPSQFAIAANWGTVPNSLECVTSKPRFLPQLGKIEPKQRY
jgi:hypothetical protein